MRALIRRLAPLLLLAVGVTWFGISLVMIHGGVFEAFLGLGGLTLIILGVFLGAWRFLEGFRF